MFPHPNHNRIAELLLQYYQDSTILNGIEEKELAQYSDYIETLADVDGDEIGMGAFAWCEINLWPTS